MNKDKFRIGCFAVASISFLFATYASFKTGRTILGIIDLFASIMSAINVYINIKKIKND